jgi:hypothetical protein
MGIVGYGWNEWDGVLGDTNTDRLATSIVDEQE